MPRKEGSAETANSETVTAGLKRLKANPGIQNSEKKIAKTDYMSFSGEFPNTGSTRFERERRTARPVIGEASFTWGNQYKTDCIL